MTYRRLAWAAVCVLLATSAQADEYWEYGDWRVSITDEYTGEDYRRYCRASTGGDGMPVLSLEISDGDAGPPHGYPTPVYSEYAPRGYRTSVGNAQGVVFVFDQQGTFYSIAEAGVDRDGIAWVNAQPRWQDVKNMLLWMKYASHMEVRGLDAYRQSTQVYVASLSGFTASYGKMMDSCGFTIEIPRD